MFEFIKRVFKREEIRKDPRVTYAEVDRVPVKRVKIEKFEPKRFEPELFEHDLFKTAKTERIWRYRYTDTGEIVEKPAKEAFNEIMGSTRPVTMLGFVE